MALIIWIGRRDMDYFPPRLVNTALLLAFLYAPFAFGKMPAARSCHPSLPAQGETPASLSCIYGLTPSVAGCPINNTCAVPQTGSGAIAIIDGQDDPSAFAELSQFSNQFTGLNVLSPCNSNNTNQPCFQQYYVSYPFNPTVPCVVANNTATISFNIQPATDVEPELDIEWAHAMAPYASIYMIETQGWGDETNPNNPDITSLIHGVQCATYLLQQYNGGRGITSYSHSFPEWAGETAYDAYFQTPGIIYIMSSGDYSKPANYPATSPYVIAAGGTSIQRDASGNYIDQVAWHDSNPRDCNPRCKTGGSGGPSLYESRPSFQNSIQKIVGNKRGTPDISFAAANIDVFCCQFQTTNNNCCGPGITPCQTISASICPSTQGAWVTTGGTSLASPALAGIINSAHSGATSTNQELSMIYTQAIKNYHTYWTDIIFGNNGYSALQGYDFTTGLGVPRGYGGK
jgi:kumamolisin